MATILKVNDEYFLVWSGVPTTLDIVETVIRDAQEGRPLASKASVLARCLASPTSSSPSSSSLGSATSPRSPLPLASGGGFSARAAAASQLRAARSAAIPRFFERAIAERTRRSQEDLRRVAARIAGLVAERKTLTIDSTLWTEAGLGAELSGLSSWVQPQLFVQMVRWIEEEQRGDRPLSPFAEAAGGGGEAAAKAAQLRFSMLLCRKVGHRDLLRFWEREVAPYDAAERLFRALHAASCGGATPALSAAVSPSTSFLAEPTPAAGAAQSPARVARAVRERSRRAALAHLSLSCAEIEPVVQRVLDRHPGLAFLSGAEEFQTKYVTTVAVRILHSTTNSGKRRRFDRCPLKQLRASPLQATLALLDDHEEGGAGRDINAERCFWSYEHFYVLYTHFWELDTDKDGFLSRKDLLRYSANALTPLAVERVFACWVRDPARGMDYREWISFLTCEVDKTTPQALRYWHAVLDLDGTGVVRPNEIAEFWAQQSKRLQSRGMDGHAFDDLMCQFSDMVHLFHEGAAATCAITVADLERNAENASSLFNRLFNLNRYLELEAHDPFAALEEKLASGDAPLTPWDRWAAEEYRRFAAEEQGGGGGGGDDDDLWSDDGVGGGSDRDEDEYGAWVGWGDEDDEENAAARDDGEVLRESSRSEGMGRGGGGNARPFNRDFCLSDDEGGSSSKLGSEEGTDESSGDADEWAQSTVVDGRYRSSSKRAFGDDDGEGEEELLEEAGGEGGDPFASSFRHR